MYSIVRFGDVKEDPGTGAFVCGADGRIVSVSKVASMADTPALHPSWFGRIEVSDWSNQVTILSQTLPTWFSREIGRNSGDWALGIGCMMARFQSGGT